jgi:hypothetical protein
MGVFVDASGRSLQIAAPMRRLPLSEVQITARRNALWLRLYEVGTPDEVTGRVERLSCQEIADLWRISRETVRLGIVDARRRRRELGERRREFENRIEAGMLA